MKGKLDPPELLRVDEHDQLACGRAACTPDELSLAPELARVRKRTGALTVGLSVGALSVATALALLDVHLALLPVAFVLGWLNLVGL